jgi:predicted MPP superfamily phosphohydrolase
MSLLLDEPAPSPTLDPRLTTEHAERRLAEEARLEARTSSGAVDFLDGDKWYSVHAAIRSVLRMTRLYNRGQANAERIVVRENIVRSPLVPAGFAGFTLLQISDIHVERHPGAMRRLIGMVGDLDFDGTVLTGDYRARTHGPFDASLEAVAALHARLRGPVWGILGNHDSLRMVPRLEAMGIRILLNEWTPIVRGGDRICLAGVDDEADYAAADIGQATAGMPRDAFAILLSHTPATYREAAAAGFSLLLAGHTHGGQICLPGGVPLTLASPGLLRRLGSGAWRYGTMDGYTSAGVGCSGVDVRFNCPPEITLHRLVPMT